MQATSEPEEESYEDTLGPDISSESLIHFVDPSLETVLDRSVDDLPQKTSSAASASPEPTAAPVVKSAPSPVAPLPSPETQSEAAAESARVAKELLGTLEPASVAPAAAPIEPVPAAAPVPARSTEDVLKSVLAQAAKIREAKLRLSTSSPALASVPDTPTAGERLQAVSAEASAAEDKAKLSPQLESVAQQLEEHEEQVKPQVVPEVEPKVEPKIEPPLRVKPEPPAPTPLPAKPEVSVPQAQPPKALKEQPTPTPTPTPTQPSSPSEQKSFKPAKVKPADVVAETQSEINHAMSTPMITLGHDGRHRLPEPVEVKHNNEGTEVTGPIPSAQWVASHGHGTADVHTQELASAAGTGTGTGTAAVASKPFNEGRDAQPQPARAPIAVNQPSVQKAKRRGRRRLPAGTEESEQPAASAVGAAGQLIMPSVTKPKDAISNAPLVAKKPDKLAQGEVFVDETGNVIVGE